MSSSPAGNGRGATAGGTEGPPNHDRDDDDNYETERARELALVRDNCDALRFRCFCLSCLNVVCAVALAVSSFATYVWTVFASVFLLIMFGISAAHLRTQQSLEDEDCCCTDSESFPRRFQNFNIIAIFLSFASLVSSVSALVSYSSLPNARTATDLAIVGVASSLVIFLLSIVGARFSGELRELTDMIFMPSVVIEVASAVPVATAVPLTVTVPPGEAAHHDVQVGIPVGSGGASPLFRGSPFSQPQQQHPGVGGGPQYVYPTGSYYPQPASSAPGYAPAFPPPSASPPYGSGQQQAVASNGSPAHAPTAAAPVGGGVRGPSPTASPAYYYEGGVGGASPMMMRPPSSSSSLGRNAPASHPTAQNSEPPVLV